MRARTFRRWVARAVFAAALGVGLAVPVAAANAGESGIGGAVAVVAKPVVYQTFEFEWA